METIKVLGQVVTNVTIQSKSGNDYCRFEFLCLASSSVGDNILVPCLETRVLRVNSSALNVAKLRRNSFVFITIEFHVKDETSYIKINDDESEEEILHKTTGQYVGEVESLTELYFELLTEDIKLSPKVVAAVVKQIKFEQQLELLKGLN